MNAAGPPPQLTVLINALTESRVLVGACDAVLVWEWLTCLPAEIKYIWRSEIRFTTIVFLLLRYFTFVTLGLLSMLFFWSGSEDGCKRMISLIQILPTIVLALAHTLIAIRIYALYDKNKFILAFLGAIIVAQIVTQSYIASLITAAPRVTPIITYCLPQNHQEYALGWGLPMGYDTVVLALSMFKLVSVWRSRGHSRLVQVLFRDQILWYVLIESLSIINLVVAYAMPAPPTTKGRGVVSVVLTIITSISACRVLLNIRQTAYEDGSRAPSSGHQALSDRTGGVSNTTNGTGNNSKRFTQFGSSSQARGQPTYPRTPLSPAYTVKPYSSHGEVISQKGAVVEDDGDRQRDIELGDAAHWKVDGEEYEKGQYALR